MIFEEMDEGGTTIAVKSETGVFDIQGVESKGTTPTIIGVILRKPGGEYYYASSASTYTPMISANSMRLILEVLEKKNAELKEAENA